MSRAEARGRLAADPWLGHPNARVYRDELLALAETSPWDAATRARAVALVGKALAAQDFLARPGTIEDVWAIEGYLDRLAAG